MESLAMRYVRDSLGELRVDELNKIKWLVDIELLNRGEREKPVCVSFSAAVSQRADAEQLEPFETH